MKGQAMAQIVDKMENLGFELSKMKALEVFAREGEWQTFAYAKKVKSLDAWEINSQFIKKLKKNFPKANVKITDSAVEIKKKRHFGKYDFVVVDNPANCFGPGNKYCEHFDLMPHICHLLKKEGILILDVITEPFDYEKYPHWRQRREKFYGTKKNKLNIKWLQKFYKKTFSQAGFLTRFSFYLLRRDYIYDNIYYLVFCFFKK